MTKQVHMPAQERRNEILAAAMKLSEEVGYTHITRDKVAELAGCANGLVTRYFGTINLLHRAVVSEAIRTENLRILAQALVLNHPKAKRAPDELKRRALESILA